MKYYPFSQGRQERKDVIGYDLDTTLLKFSSTFVILYDVFTIITGSFSDHNVEYHIYELHVLYGFLEIIQVALQMVFLLSLGSKVT